MGHKFEQAYDADVDATVDEVWQAIATGPGIDAWFMGRTEVENGVVRTNFGDWAPESPITVEEPGKRFGYRMPDGPDGRFIAYEYLIEGRAGGGTSLRVVASGFLPGDDWAEEFEAMSKGGAMYFRTLVEYVNHFAGRTATPFTAFGPPVEDWNRAWEKLGAALGLDRPVREGDKVRVSVGDGEATDGVAFYVNEQTVSIRTADAFYRFVQGFHGPMLAMHQLFTPDADAIAAGRDWQEWLGRVFS